MFKITKISSFLTNSKQHSCMRFESSTDISQSHYQALQAQEANKFVQIISNLKEYLKSEMKWAQAIYKFNTNQKQDFAFIYQVKNYIFINTHNMKIQHPSKKLDWKNLDTISIIKVVSLYTYKL